MDLEGKSLFSKGKSNNLGKLYGKWKVKKQGIAMQAELYEHGLLEISGADSSCKTI